MEKIPLTTDTYQTTIEDFLEEADDEPRDSDDTPGSSR